VHVPVAAILLLAPVMGLAFAVALPALGFLLTLQAGGQKLVQAGARAFGEVAATMVPVMVPGEAHLAGKPEEKAGEPKKEEQAAPAELEHLAKEIESRREKK
jgi:hypothetical protein